MVAKKGDLKAHAEWENEIIQNAKAYKVVGFQPQAPRKHFQTFDNLVWAKAYAQELMKNTGLRLRTAMVYAIGDYDHTTLIGSYDVNGNWKEVTLDRY